MNYYPNYNQFYGQPTMAQMPKTQPIEQQYPQYNIQPMFNKQTGLQGKSVDSIEVVKAMEIPLDGTVSYFPLTDGTAIVSKQLLQDGTSKTVIYKPTENTDTTELPKYITEEELEEKIKNVNNDSLKNDIKDLKRKVEDLSEDITSINKEMKKRKD